MKRDEKVKIEWQREAIYEQLIDQAETLKDKRERELEVDQACIQ